MSLAIDPGLREHRPDAAKALEESYSSPELLRQCRIRGALTGLFLFTAIVVAPWSLVLCLIPALCAFVSAILWSCASCDRYTLPRK